MERLRQLLNDIGAQLGVLTVTQRLLMGTFAALIAVSMFSLLQWSTTPEMVPLNKADFAFDDLDSAEAALRDEGINFTIHGMRILVRSSDRPRVPERVRFALLARPAENALSISLPLPHTHRHILHVCTHAHHHSLCLTSTRTPGDWWLWCVDFSLYTLFTETWCCLRF